MKKVMVVFGTRPEAIKMCPVVKELEKSENIETLVCVTGQHKEMLNQVLEVFNVKPKYNLNIMRKVQTLTHITSDVLNGIDDVLKKEKPDIVLVHGDTSTTFSTALSCFYNRVDVGHVEAGLRTYNIMSPYPEEFNRKAVSIVAKYHFSPTENSKSNLINEGVNKANIVVTGNTAIDALRFTIQENYNSEIIDWIGNDKLILVTAHRRENLGNSMVNMFRAIKKIVDCYSNIKVIYPIHKNPLVRRYADSIFKDCKNIKLIEPLNVIDFHNLMNKAYIVMTDSGGIQEEAPSLGKPVLVMRDTTERPEGVSAGTLKLVGTNFESIYKNFEKLFLDENEYMRMSNITNPYGDGDSSSKIVRFLEKVLY